MAHSQEPSNPLLSALSSLTNRAASKKEPMRLRDDQSRELSAEDYPELELRRRAKAASAPAVESPAATLPVMIAEGQARQMDAAQLGILFDTLLKGGLHELFAQTVEQVRRALESQAPDDRRWGISGVRALLAPEELNLIPQGTLPPLLECLSRMLVKEERVELRDAALETCALLLGIEAVQGDLETVHGHLAWLERTARGRGIEYCERIMASRNVVLPMLRLFFREGDAVLESCVLPFFRFVGEPGARTLTQLLDEDGSRQHRSRILVLLKQLGPMSVPALKAGLVAGSWHLVRNALNLVGELEEPQAFEYVVPCLDHSDTRVVHAAIHALRKTGGKRAERYYLDLLPKADPVTQCELLDGLAQISAAGAIPSIGKLTASPSQTVRIKALEALGQIGHEAAVPILVQQLKRKGRIFKTAEPMPVRLAAARALAQLKAPAARQALDQALAEEPKGQDLEALRSASAAGSLRA